MDAIVKLEEGMRFQAVANSERPIILDSSVAGGGSGMGPTPMELVLMGLAGCTAMDVVSILRKKRQDVTDFEIRAHADKSTDHPKVFTSATLEYVVTGRNIDPAAVERAIQLSTETYCSVHAMLHKAMQITTTYRIIEVD